MSQTERTRNKPALVFSYKYVFPYAISSWVSTRQEIYWGNAWAPVDAT